MPEIVVKKKAEILKRYIVGDEPINVGRIKENDIFVDDEAVSEEHCVIKKRGDKLVVEDLNTAFGTQVNGTPIRKEDVGVGDEIKIGEHVLKIDPLEEKPEQTKAYLLGIQGKMEGREFELEPEETKIGRSEEFNNVWISKKIDKSVSRRHATITREDDKFILEDRRSKNRTFVNQKQVNEDDKVNLVENDEILIGKSIFRFVKGKDNFNWKPPKKAGVFWVRKLSLFRKIAAVLLVFISLFCIYVGVTGILTINEQPAEVTLDNQNWQPEEFAPTEEGYLIDVKLDVIPSPTIGDINGDGTADIVMADAEGNVYAWSGIGSNLLWKEELGGRKLTSPTLADINNNGILEVVVGADNSRVYILDGATGDFLYRSDFIGGDVLPGSSILVVDLDGNEIKDLVTVTDDNVITIQYSPVIGNKEPFYFTAPERIMSSPVLIKNPEEEDKVAVPTNGGQIYFFEASNPDNREVVDVTQKINMLEGTNLVLNEINTIPAVYDLNGDGVEDMVFATSGYYVVALDGKDYSLLWVNEIEPYSTSPEPLRHSSPVISDFTGNGKPDVALGWANGKVIAIDGSEGETLWEYELEEEVRIISSPALADLNKDSTMDIIIGDETGRIYVFNGKSGDVDRTLNNKKSLNSGITSTPIIGDINADGYLEMLITSINNEIHKFSLPTRVFKNSLEWPSFRKDARNSGTKFFIDEVPAYQFLTGGGGVVLIGVFLVASLLKKKKAAKRPEIIDGRS
ncbi:MAG: FHA domain-containing protein [Elusimicrobiota bacterium]